MFLPAENSSPRRRAHGSVFFPFFLGKAGGRGPAQLGRGRMNRSPDRGREGREGRGSGVLEGPCAPTWPRAATGLTTSVTLSMNVL